MPSLVTQENRCQITDHSKLSYKPSVNVPDVQEMREAIRLAGAKTRQLILRLALSSRRINPVDFIIRLFDWYVGSVVS